MNSNVWDGMINKYDYHVRLHPIGDPCRGYKFWGPTTSDNTNGTANTNADFPIYAAIENDQYDNMIAVERGQFLEPEFAYIWPESEEGDKLEEANRRIVKLEKSIKEMSERFLALESALKELIEVIVETGSLMDIPGQSFYGIAKGVSTENDCDEHPFGAERYSRNKYTILCHLDNDMLVMGFADGEVVARGLDEDVDYYHYQDETMSCEFVDESVVTLIDGIDIKLEETWLTDDTKITAGYDTATRTWFVLKGSLKTKKSPSTNNNPHFWTTIDESEIIPGVVRGERVAVLNNGEWVSWDKTVEWFSIQDKEDVEKVANKRKIEEALKCGCGCSLEYVNGAYKCPECWKVYDDLGM